MKKNINNVTISYLRKHSGVVYSDGDVEDELLKLFKSTNHDKRREKILNTNPSWPLYYHLSPQRGALVDWIDFRKDASVLEVGAGCGAITEALVQKEINVTALELSERRALINAHRNSTAKNLSVITGNLEDLKAGQKFDYIVCVGVLEYAGTFINSDTPYEAFIKKMKSHLNDDGILIIAIENRLGIKYWAGAREDHTGGFFDSLNQYPHPKRVQTFGKEELKGLLETCGLLQTKFHFPFPDYKHPTAVFSESLLPSSEKFNFPLSTLPGPARDQSRAWLFSEGLAMQTLEANSLFADFSNSFLVFASNKRLSSDQPVFYRSNRGRNDKFLIGTTIHRHAKGLEVQKTALSKKGEAHIKAMGDNYKKLLDIFDKKLLSVVESSVNHTGTVSFPFIEGVSLDRYVLNNILANDIKTVEDTFNFFIQSIERLPKASYSDNYKEVFGNVDWPKSTTFVSPALIDSNFDNIIIDGSGRWNLIDYEWVFDFSIPLDFLIARSLINFFQTHSSLLRYHSDRVELFEQTEGVLVPGYIYKTFKKYFELAPLVLEMEIGFQKYVLGKELEMTSVMKKTPQKVHPHPSPVEEYLAIPNLHQRVDELERFLKKTQEEFSTIESAYNKLRYRWRRRILYLPKLALRAVRKVKRKYENVKFI